jgi:hypothetical protein
MDCLDWTVLTACLGSQQTMFTMFRQKDVILVRLDLKVSEIYLV